jgi:hypothetical protein
VWTQAREKTCTLADLEKEVGKGRTPEQIVGRLAIRTPDMGATVSQVFAGRQVLDPKMLPMSSVRCVTHVSGPDLEKNGGPGWVLSHEQALPSMGKSPPLKRAGA